MSAILKKHHRRRSFLGLLFRPLLLTAAAGALPWPGSARAEDDEDDDDDDNDDDDDDDEDDDGDGGSTAGSGSGGEQDDGDDDQEAGRGRPNGVRRDYPNGYLGQSDVRRAVRNGDAMGLNTALSRLRRQTSGLAIDTRLFSTGSRLVYVFTVREADGVVTKHGIDARSGAVVRIR